MIDLAGRTNSLRSMEKALVIHELLYKAEGGMFPTPSEDDVVAVKPARDLKAPPGFVAVSVMVKRGGKMFRSTRYVKSGEKEWKAAGDKLAAKEEEAVRKLLPEHLKGMKKGSKVRIKTYRGDVIIGIVDGIVAEVKPGHVGRPGIDYTDLQGKDRWAYMDQIQGLV